MRTFTGVKYCLSLLSTILVLTLVPATNALAQARTTSVVPAGHWTVTPFIGTGFSGDLDSATGALGVAGGYLWNDRVALEGEVNSLPSPELGGLVEVDSKAWTLTGNLLYHFFGESFVPYGIVGIGLGRGSIDVTNGQILPATFETSSTTFVLTFGGGAERKIRERVAFRGDLRYFFGGDLMPDYWRLSAGLTIDLGKR